MSSDTRRGTTARTIANELRQRIVRWELPHGHRLTEQELTDEYGVSRSPVREALRQLAAEGYVEIVPRAGYRVVQPSVEEIEDLYEYRLALELMVIERLARHVRRTGDTQWVESLRDVPLTEGFADADRAFHEGLARAAGNHAIHEALTTINDRLMVFREMEAEVPGRYEQTNEQHQAVLDALMKGDEDAACAAIRRNINGALENVESLLGNAMVRGMGRSSAEERAGSIIP